MYSMLVCVWVHVCKGWNPVHWPSSTDIFLHQPCACHSTHQQNRYNNHHYDSSVHWSVFTLLKLHKQRGWKILRCDESRMWNVKMYCIIPWRLTQILSAALAQFFFMSLMTSENDLANTHTMCLILSLFRVTLTITSDFLSSCFAAEWNAGACFKKYTLVLIEYN